MEDWPETPRDLAELRSRVLANRLHRNTLISEDASLTTVSIRLYAFESMLPGIGYIGPEEAP
jgi:hypothetical protein